MANGTASQGSAPDIGACFNTGLERFKPYMGILIGITLVALLLLIGLGTLTRTSWILGTIASIAVTSPIFLGLMRVYRTAYRGSQPAFNQLFSGFQEYVPVVISGAAYVLIIQFVGLLPRFLGIMGALLSLLLTLAVSGLLVYWPLVYDDGKKEGIDAVLGSKDVAQPFLIQSVVTVFVMGLVGLIGLGVLTGPIAGMGIIHAYETMKGSQGAESPSSASE